MRLLLCREAPAGVRCVAVDGLPRGAHLELSHWPGNRTPARLKADTSTGIALNLAAAKDRADLLAGCELVINDHLDCDGLLAAWTVFNPDDALVHAPDLVAAAEAGDFAWFTTPAGVRLALLLDDVLELPGAAELLGVTGGEARSREQQAADALLARMPGLLTDLGALAPLVQAPYDRVVDSLAAFARGEVQAHDVQRAALSVVMSSRPLERLAVWTWARFDRVLRARRAADGNAYVLELTARSWFDTPAPPRGRRVPLQPIARALQALEPERGVRWLADPEAPSKLHSRLWSAGSDGSEAASGLDFSMVEEVVVAALLEAEKSP